MLPIVDKLPSSPSTKIFQKLVLKQLRLDKVSRDSETQILIDGLENTSSSLFLPFRVILYRIDRNKKQI